MNFPVTAYVRVTFYSLVEVFRRQGGARWSEAQRPILYAVQVPFDFALDRIMKLLISHYYT